MIPDVRKTVEKVSFITNCTRNTKVKIPHTYAYTHSLWAWVNQLHGALYMVSGSVQITAFFRFLPVIILAALIQLYIFYRQTGRMGLIILRSFSAHHTITYTLTTDYREQSACERETEAPPFTAPWAFGTKT